MSSKKNKRKKVTIPFKPEPSNIFVTIDGKVLSDREESEWHEKNIKQAQYDKLYGKQSIKEKDEPPIQIEYTNSALWAIADDMRFEKEEGKFDKYMDAYRYAAKKYVRKDGVEITAEKLQSAWHKAKSEGVFSKKRKYVRKED